MDFIHLRAPKNWINDPNGFIYYKGKYHVFYQHFPYEPEWGTMHWGHAISTDLVHWEHQKIAIYPSKAYDRNGVFSGNAMEKDGKLYLYYTGIRYPNPDAEFIHVTADGKLEASQVLMISKDGEHFDNKCGKQCIIAPSVDDEIMSRSDTRDPKVWFQDGAYYMILGSTRMGCGKLVFLKSTDGIQWEYQSSICDRGFGSVFECPDFFTLDGEQVLFCAATDYLQDGVCYEAQEIYKFVNFDAETCSMSWEPETRLLDYGMDLYATQTNLDEFGNRVLLAWMRMPEPKVDEKRGQWNGMMIMPRILSVKNHHLYCRPHDRIDAMFQKELDIHEIEKLTVTEAKEYKILGAEESEAIYKISVDANEGTEIRIGDYRIKVQDGKVMTDRSKAYVPGKYRMKCETPVLRDGCHLDIYVDKDIIEIYANQGEYVISNIIY